MSERVYQIFQQSVEAKMTVGEELAPLVDNASKKIVESLVNDGKILICANGASAALSQIFTSALIDRYEKERPSLPAIWLGANIPTYTAISSNESFNEVYAKPITALAKPGDIVLIVTTSGNPKNLIQAAHAAHQRGAAIIALTGRDGGELSKILESGDLEVNTHITSRGRIHEIHLLILNTLCDLIDHQLFGIE